MANMLEQSKLSWHPGFYGAAELEFISDKKSLEFQREYTLSKEPLRIDLMIIKKLTDTCIENEIGRIFRKYNIIEYKSPEDGLTIDDYYKTLGYACLYKGLGESVGQIPANELTISLFRESYPRELFVKLKQEGYLVENKFPGIFYIKRRLPFDAQVVVTSRLEPGKHLGLKMLSQHVSEADARAFMEKAKLFTDPGDRNNAEAVLQVSVPANRKIYDSIRRVWNMNDVLRDWLKEDIDRIVSEEVEKRLNEEVGKRLNEEVGKRLDEEVGKRLNEEAENTILTDLRNLIRNTKWTAEQAMAAISIPPAERTRYAAKL